MASSDFIKYFDNLEEAHDEHLGNEVALLSGMESMTSDTIFRVMEQQWSALQTTSSGSGDPTIVLFGDGCLTQSGAHDCPQLCSNESALFGNWMTQWTCLTLALLTLSDAVNSSRRGVINDQLAYLDMSLGQNSTTFGAMGVLGAVNECTVASCDKSAQQAMGYCTMENLTFPASTAGNSSRWQFAHELLTQWPTICDASTTSISVDVAGPGVLVSYIMQATMLFYTWGLVRIFTATSTINSLMTPFVWLYVKAKNKNAAQPPFIELRSRLARILRLLRGHNFATSTGTFLVEFQEAQCFLALAVQIAVWYAISKDAGFNGAQNWATLANTQAVFFTLATVGEACVVVTQMNLRRFGMDSTYTFILATVTTIVASSVTSRALDRSWEEVRGMFNDVNLLPECGGRSSIRTYCMGSTYDEFNEFTLWPLYFHYIALGILWLKKILRVLADLLGPEWFIKRFRRFRKTTKILRLVGFVVPKLATLCLLVAEGFMLAMIGLGLGSIKRDFESILGAELWNVGQIITMLVWAPVIAKYLYLIVVGVPKGFAMRLSEPFIVKRKDPKTRNESPRASRTWATQDSEHEPAEGQYAHITQPDSIKSKDFEMAPVIPPQPSSGTAYNTHVGGHDVIEESLIYRGDGAQRGQE